MRDLAAVRAEDFEPAIGTVFEIALAGHAPLALRLTEVRLHGERPGHRRPFSLEFLGPGAPVLAHATHAIAHPQLGELELFLGPIVSDADGITYEAVFS
jgi:hypothetical protein